MIEGEREGERREGLDGWMDGKKGERGRGDVVICTINNITENNSNHMECVQ